MSKQSGIIFQICVAFSEYLNFIRGITFTESTNCKLQILIFSRSLGLTNEKIVIRLPVCNSNLQLSHSSQFVTSQFLSVQFFLPSIRLWFWKENSPELTVISHRFSMIPLYFVWHDQRVSYLFIWFAQVSAITLYVNYVYFTELWIWWTLAICRAIYKGKQQCRERRVVQQRSWSFSGNLPSSRRNGRSQVKYTTYINT